MECFRSRYAFFLAIASPKNKKLHINDIRLWILHFLQNCKEVVPPSCMKKKFDISERFDTWRFALPYVHEKSRRVKDLCLAESGTHFTLSCVKTAASRSRRCIRDTWHSPPRDGNDDSRLNVVQGDAVGSSRCYTSFVLRHRHSIVLHQKLRRPCRWSPAAIYNAERILKIAELPGLFLDSLASAIVTRRSAMAIGKFLSCVDAIYAPQTRVSVAYVAVKPDRVRHRIREFDAIKSDCLQNWWMRLKISCRASKIIGIYQKRNRVCVKYNIIRSSIA